MTLAEKKRQLLDTISLIRDQQLRLSWLVEQARQRPLLPAEFRTEDRLVPGCTARLWLVTEFREGRCYFRCDSDSLIVKSIAGLLCDFYSGATPGEIPPNPPDFLASAGINQHLTSNRRNALTRVWEHIRHFAEAASLHVAIGGGENLRRP